MRVLRMVDCRAMCATSPLLLEWLGGLLVGANRLVTFFAHADGGLRACCGARRAGDARPSVTLLVVLAAAHLAGRLILGLMDHRM